MNTVRRHALTLRALSILSVYAVGCTLFPDAENGSEDPEATGADGAGPGGRPRGAKPIAPPGAIPDGAECTVPSECASGVCKATRCEKPTATDSVKNGTETDVDCGGSEAPRCGTGNLCKAHADCASDGCAFDGRCASHPSCTKLEGGYTCGPNEGSGKQTDCCESAAVGTYSVDKFLVTAGRMRAFIERLDGNVRGWASTLPPEKWNADYTKELPDSLDAANEQLGPFYDKRSCQTGDFTGHTYWTPPSAEDTKDFSKEVLDAKALNCVPWWLLSALCVWDGGHLTTEAELSAAYTNAKTTKYPWGAADGYTVSQQTDFAIQKNSYATPNPPASARMRDGGFLDVAYYIARPGSRPKGYNATGHADLVGNLLEWVGDSERQFVWKASFEDHGAEAVKESGRPNDPYLARSKTGAVWQWGTNIGVRPTDGRGIGYYAIGGRCSRN